MKRRGKMILSLRTSRSNTMVQGQRIQGGIGSCSEELSFRDGNMEDFGELIAVPSRVT